MAKIKVFYTEGYDTWIVKNPVEIDTDSYPELQGLNEDEIIEYLKNNADNMKSSDGSDPEEWSLYDECQEQTDLKVKESNNEVSFLIEK